jgi:PAS domain S-box-containing protein
MMPGVFNQFTEIRDYAIIVLDVRTNIVSWSLGADPVFGCRSSEALGSTFAAFYADEQKADQQIGIHLEKCVKHGRFEEEIELLKKDGSTFYANLIYTNRYDDGELAGYVATVRDITIQKHLKLENKALQDGLEFRVQQRTEELEKINKELNAFSYSVSHDLRTPLRAISGYSQMFLDDYSETLDAEGQRILGTIIENTELMAKLIDNLLQFSRLSRLEVLDQHVNMKAIVDRCIEDLLPIWPNPYVITVADLPTCYADANMMRQVWMNLIENAMKYSSRTEEPFIKIGCREDELSHTYFIEDNGVGFDMQYAGKLFGVFQRLHTNDQFIGTGLGLALVKRIVTKHDGSIWAKSQENIGATFHFRIPKMPTKTEEI